MAIRKFAPLDESNKLPTTVIPPLPPEVIPPEAHPNLAGHDTLGLVTDDILATHAAGPHGGGSAAPWKGVIAACVSDGDPDKMLGRLLHNPIHATPTNISTSVARCSYFRLDTALTVANLRWFGVGATTGVYHLALYRNSDGARLTSDLSPNTAAQTWGAVAAGGVALAADTLYFVAVSVDSTGTTAGMGCCSGTTGRIGVLPTSWPGSLDIDAATPRINPFGFAQFAVTTGALPTTAPARVAQAAWTGGMPAIFMDSV